MSEKQANCPSCHNPAGWETSFTDVEVWICNEHGDEPFTFVVHPDGKVQEFLVYQRWYLWGVEQWENNK